jgi:hypothetical protein
MSDVIDLRRSVVFLAFCEATASETPKFARRDGCNGKGYRSRRFANLTGGVPPLSTALSSIQ